VANLGKKSPLNLPKWDSGYSNKKIVPGRRASVRNVDLKPNLNVEDKMFIKKIKFRPFSLGEGKEG
jgi:hypothetical protein